MSTPLTPGKNEIPSAVLRCLMSPTAASESLPIIDNVNATKFLVDSREYALKIFDPLLRIYISVKDAVVEVGTKLWSYVSGDVRIVGIIIGTVAVCGVVYYVCTPGSYQNGINANPDTQNQPPEQPTVTTTPVDVPLRGGYNGAVASSEELRLVGVCQMCHVYPANVFLVPCGHRCFCDGCFKEYKITQCPLDRSRIQQAYQIK